MRKVPKNRKRLSAKDIAFGNKQVKKMLSDRPSMKKYMKENDPILKWAVRKFAGEDLSDTIDWNPDLPTSSYQADHYSPTETERGAIRIKEAHEELWACAVFELFNIASAQEFEKAHNKALDGCYSKKEYIEANTKIEYKAVKKIQKFYKDIWEPWAKKKKMVTHPELWFMNVPKTFKAWIKLYKDKNAYPWDSWGKYYDDVIVPWVKENKKNKK